LVDEIDKSPHHLAQRLSEGKRHSAWYMGYKARRPMGCVCEVPKKGSSPLKKSSINSSLKGGAFFRVIEKAELISKRIRTLLRHRTSILVLST